MGPGPKRPSYWSVVRATARTLGSDGCTCAPDLWIRECCLEHDVAYRTGRTVRGKPISRWRADWNFLRCMQRRSPLAAVWLGGLSPISWIYWGMVRAFGSKNYTGAKPTGIEAL